jgi:hypothetical protein
MNAAAPSARSTQRSRAANSIAERSEQVDGGNVAQLIHRTRAKHAEHGLVVRERGISAK